MDSVEDSVLAAVAEEVEVEAAAVVLEAVVAPDPAVD